MRYYELSNTTDGDSTFGSLECADIQRDAEKLASPCSVTPLTPRRYNTN